MFDKVMLETKRVQFFSDSQCTLNIVSSSRFLIQYRVYIKQNAVV